MSLNSDNLIRGLGSLANLMPARSTPDFTRGLPSSPPAASDMDAIGGDFRRVGGDITRAIAEYERRNLPHERRKRRPDPAAG